MDQQLLAGYAATAPVARMSNHGTHMCKVAMQTGNDLYARAGSMVAYEGYIQFQANPPSLGRGLGEWATGEGVPLMRASGDGVLYLADYGADVVVLQLAGDRLSVNGANVLAYDANLTSDIERVRGVARLSGSGLFNLMLGGNGWVALTTRGTPVVLDTGEQETYVDPDALIAWTTGLRIKGKRSFKAGSLIGRGSGEAYQVGFSGRGFVVVQPSEDSTDRLRVRG
ncbi:AIM24 family protein [Allostreptomyces psammosilenae]|uniref:Uncharacterized protein (AIM24 family) n=1 Tax=Allostreptomyces psammosilenae TaxID=1892865 RepID=A0A853A6U7_9ACTN|nr:AIM24 family protein [Allostreptomyces psammosilenae]NYI06268.1 uncharacterized protein (AIM24 family) [Allostreptomyces psammosilenae]